MFAHKIRQILSEKLHQIIPCNQAHAVIDPAKIVKVDKHDGHLAFILFRVAQKFSQKPDKIIAIIKPCQYIVICHVGKLILRHVLKPNDFIRRLPVGVVHDIHFHLYAEAAVLQPNFKALSFPVLLLYKQTFPERNLILFFNALIKSGKIPHIGNREMEKMFPVSQRFNSVFLITIINKCAV